MNAMQLKLFKATITLPSGEPTEVPVWAKDLEEALEQAEQAYGGVTRMRPQVTHEGVPA